MTKEEEETIDKLIAYHEQRERDMGLTIIRRLAQNLRRQKKYGIVMEIAAAGYVEGWLKSSELDEYIAKNIVDLTADAVKRHDEIFATVV